MSNNSPLSVHGVTHFYDGLEVIRNLTLEIARGEFIAVVGPSGCGKTTLLNILSGYMSPAGGVVHRDGRMRMVYQRGGLFPWLTAADNIRLGLRHMRDDDDRERQLQALLELIGLEEFAHHYPRQLSGGMAQRIELARALAGNTDILLMDEPFSALDYLGRLHMRIELSRILQERPCTVVFVTHDIQEAVQLADRVLVLSERPARIKRELCVRLPRPRSVTHPDVVEAVQDILGEMGFRVGGNGAGQTPQTANIG